MENIERIMKPYFDKKNEPEKESEKLNKTKEEFKINRKIQKRVLEARLQNLRDNKEREISEYLSEYTKQDMPSSNYLQIIRADLEKAYRKREEEYLEDIKRFEKRTEEEKVALRELRKLNKNQNYQFIYQKELNEIGEVVTEELYQEKKNLELQLEEIKMNFDSAMLKLNEFNYEYNDQHQVTNGYKFKELYDESSKLIEKMSKIKKSIEQVDKYINEIREYKNSTIEPELTVETESVVAPDLIVETEPNLVLEQEIQKTGDVLPIDDIDPMKDEIVYNATRRGKKIIADSYSDLLKMVYNDIINEVKSINAIRLDPSKKYLAESEAYISQKVQTSNYSILGKVDLGNKEKSVELPCGEYINTKDFENALDIYFQKNKGNIYEVKGYNNVSKMSLATLEDCKESLKKCSTIKLLKDNKISAIDIRRVFGKEKAIEYNQEVQGKELGSVHSNLPQGDYIFRNETIINLFNLFEQKNKTWIQRALENLKESEEPEIEVTSLENPIEKKYNITR